MPSRQNTLESKSREKDGVVGSRFDKRQVPLHRGRKTGLPREGNETGQPAEGRDGFGRLIQNKPGPAKERGNFSAGRFLCRVESGCLSINPHAHGPFPKATLF